MANKLLSDLAKGAWDSGTSYTVGDIVTNDGSSYICIENHTNQEPPNATYWALLASAGTGDVVGPASATDNAVVIFDGTTGKLVQDSGKTMSGSDATVITGTAGTSGDLAQWNADGDVVGGPTPPSGTIVGTNDVQTLASKRITKRVVTTTDDATAVIDVDATDVYELSAVANATEFTLTGTPTDGQTLVVRIKDAGVSKALTWTGFTEIGVTLPTATTAGKWHYCGFMYNSVASAWHAIAVVEQT